MARSPSRSSDGGGSSHQTRAEPRLLKAIEERNNDAAIAIIEDAKAHSKPTELLLRIGLARACERGNIPMAVYLLKNGADANGAPGSRVSPLVRAVEKNNIVLVRTLLQYGGDVDVCDKQGRTAVLMAAWSNHWHVLDELLQRGADVNKKDANGRNVLHNLAADKQCNWGSSVINLLLQHTNIAIDGPLGQDVSKRTPLHWAASTGKKELCELLLTRPTGPRANINAVEAKEKTALHLAVTHGRDDIVELLIDYGADVKARSDGKWTALHNACEHGSVKIVRMLLAANAEINARLLNGKTPLHLAAQFGHLELVKCLLERDDCRRMARDADGVTPFILAAKKKEKQIVNILAPFNQVETLSRDALGACQGFNGTIVDFGNFHNENRVTKRTVFEILYGKDPTNPRKTAFTVLPKEEKAVDFRWIHLPANNMSWVEALLTKAFVEEGANDVTGFMALERSFSHQHSGQQIHSHFMRPLCQSTPRAPKQQDDSDLSDSAEQGPPAIVVSHGGSTSGLGIDTMSGSQEYHPPPPVPKMPARTGTMGTDQTDWTTGTAGSGSGKEHRHGKNKDRPKKTPKWSGGRQAGGRSGGTDTPTRSTELQKKRSASVPMSGSGSLLKSPGSPGRKDSSVMAKGNIFTYMPYLHFETDTNRKEMQNAIARAQYLRDREKRDGAVHRPSPRRAETFDEMLLRAHLGGSTASLHVRRTLDQFFYHNIDTRSRDQDQVVYRYQTRRMAPDDGEVDPKVFMVDQLWMWVLGKDLIITAFPQRWQQPKNDPLNVLDGIIENINSNTREPVRSVYDLAMIITSRCSGVFDRHRMGDEDYQFLDMFESSIGEATETETRLFEDFNAASKKASAWLQRHRRPNRFSRQLEAERRQLEQKNRRDTHSHTHRHAFIDSPTDDAFPDDQMGPTQSPLFVDELLDIGAETDLLTETKDIRDEIAMITKVLKDQRAVLSDMETCYTDIYASGHMRQQELKRRFREQYKLIDVHVADLDRMDHQAHRIYESITDLLDLKQKHANAFEARFARDQAAGTARQSQTIMVFTIVTIIFLPLSFIAAFFTINIREFPRDPGGDQPSLPLSYVSQYMFGIGFAVSIPLIAVALSLDAIADFFNEIQRRWVEHRKSRSLRRTKTYARSDKDRVSEYTVDMRALEQAVSMGRSTARGRPSVESYIGADGAFTLMPVTSRETAQSPGKKSVVVGVGENGTGTGGGALARRPQVPDRVSTGFRIRESLDVERGV